MNNPDFADARQDFESIPVIDISQIEEISHRSRIAAKLLDAATNAGFFYIQGHGISQDRIKAAMAASRAFFALPQEQKNQIKVDQNQRGWMGQGMAQLEGARTHDAKEVFFWGWDVDSSHPDLQHGLPLVALNQWPDQAAPFLRRDLLPYYLDVVKLSRNILSALAMALGQDSNFFAKAYADPLARGQLVYYPPATDKDEVEQRFGAAEHSDFGVLTILLQDMNGGLQVKNLSGDWIEAPPIENTFVCNIGDLLERWTNGRLVSTKHRVINRSGRERYSIPVFCDPNSAAVIDPMDFAPKGSQPAFAAITAGEYIAGKNRRNFSQYQKPK